MRDERAGRTHDYSRKTDLVWSGILAPSEAPRWASDRAALWANVEAREDLSTRPLQAQLFRGMVLAITRELTPEQRIGLVRAFVQDQFVNQGMVADINIHNPSASDGGEQPHAHVMLTMREIGPDGFGKKRRDWSDVQWEKGRARKEGFLRVRRERWEEYCNAALADAGFSERVAHQSLKDRGIDRKPQVTLGKAGHAKRGEPWVEQRHERLEDVHDYNTGLNLAASIALSFTPA